MSKNNFTPSFELLHELFSVSEGRLVRKLSAGGQLPGSIAGTIRLDGYRGVGIRRKYFFAHRLIWMMENGSFPANDLDHINGLKDDNRIENLRECTHLQNMQNIRKAPKTSSTGVLGVRLEARCKTTPWRAMGWKNGKNVSIGYFRTIEQAHEAYINWKRATHEFCTI